MKPTIKDTLKDLEDKPPNKGQVESTHVYTLNRKSPLKEDKLSIKDKTASPEVRGSTVSVFLFVKGTLLCHLSMLPLFAKSLRLLIALALTK